MHYKTHGTTPKVVHDVTDYVSVWVIVGEQDSVFYCAFLIKGSFTIIDIYESVHSVR